MRIDRLTNVSYRKFYSRSVCLKIEPILFHNEIECNHNSVKCDSAFLIQIVFVQMTPPAARWRHQPQVVRVGPIDLDLHVLIAYLPTFSHLRPNYFWIVFIFPPKVSPPTHEISVLLTIILKSICRNFYLQNYYADIYLLNCKHFSEYICQPHEHYLPTK